MLRLVQALPGHDDRVWCVAWSPDGSTLATCGGDKSVRMWAQPRPGAGDFACVATLEELHSRTVRCVAW